jgi:hypothetical protein
MNDFDVVIRRMRIYEQTFRIGNTTEGAARDEAFRIAAEQNHNDWNNSWCDLEVEDVTTAKKSG